MKIHIIQPTGYNPDGTLYQTKTRWVIGMTLPYLAALVPAHHEIKVTDERLQKVDFNETYDLVAITTFSHASKRAYEIARAYRERGAKVVMGGWHVSFRPEETLEQCDAVVVGEGEEMFPRLIEDVEHGTLKRIYKADDFHDLKGLPFPRYDTLPLKRYKAPYYPVQTSRGCPFRCDFCEVAQLYGSRFRFRPIDEVIEEIKESGVKSIQFVDDNFSANRRYTQELMEKLIPLRVKWTCLWTVEASRDREFVKLAKRSGCFHINMGVESISPESLKETNKKQNKVEHYCEAFRVLDEQRIFYSLNFIFGFDSDDKALFEETASFCVRNRVPMAFFSVLCPRLGTKRWDRLKKEGRLLTEDQSFFRGETCVFQPKKMEPDELEQGVWNTYRTVYSLPSIFKRVAFQPRSGYWNILMSNLYFHFGLRRKKSPLDYY